MDNSETRATKDTKQNEDKGEKTNNQTNKGEKQPTHKHSI